MIYDVAMIQLWSLHSAPLRHDKNYQALQQRTAKDLHIHFSAVHISCDDKWLNKVYLTLLCEMRSVYICTRVPLRLL